MGLGLREYYDGKQNEQGEVIGVVVANDKECDPRQLGGLKIRVKGYNDDEANIPTEDLPVVMPVRQIGTGTGEGIGSFAIPAVGTKVIVVRDDSYNWKYTSEYLTTNHAGAGNFQGSYPNVWGMKDRTGSMAQINMETHKAYFKHVSGSSLTVIRSGTCQGLVKDDLEMQIDDNGIWNYDGFLEQTIGEYKKEIIGLGSTIEIGKGLITSIGEDDKLEVGTSQAIEVGTSQTCSVGTTRECTVGDNDTLIVNGNIVITSNGGDISISTSGNCNINSSGNTNITAPTVAIQGNVTVSGTVVAQGDVIGAGTSLSTHKHPILSGSSSGITGTPA